MCAGAVEPVVRQARSQRAPARSRARERCRFKRGCRAERLVVLSPHMRAPTRRPSSGGKSKRYRCASRSGWGGVTRTPRGRGRRPRTVARSQAGEDRTTTPRWRARTRTVLSRRERRVSPFGKKNENIDYVEAENAPEERRVAPNRRATLSVHVVASPALHGALEGGGPSVRSFDDLKSPRQV